MKRFLFFLPFLSLFLFSASESAQTQNTTCPTRPAGDSSNACASTAFVKNTSQSVNIVTYGAKMDGVTDDTAAFTAARNVICSTGGTIFIPVGHTVFDGATTGSCNGIHVVGAGVYATYIQAKTATGTPITFGDTVDTRVGLSLEKLTVTGHNGLDGLPDATAGALVHAQGVLDFTMHDFVLFNWFQGILVDSPPSTAIVNITDGFIANGANPGRTNSPTARGILYTGGNTDIRLERVTITGGYSAGTPYLGAQACIYLQGNSGGVIHNVDTIDCTFGGLIQPVNGGSVLWLQIDNSTFDTSGTAGTGIGDGILVNPLDTSIVAGLQLSNVELSSSERHGINFSRGASATISGVTMSGMKIMNNGINGVDVHNADNVVMTGSLIANNGRYGGNGAQVGIASNHILFSGNRFGPLPNTVLPANQLYGIVTDAGASNFLTFTSNDTNGNATGGCNLNSTGANNYISANPGCVGPQDPITNPMTTAGDMIYGAGGGAITRLPGGLSSQVLYGGAAPAFGSSVTTINTIACNLGSSCTVTVPISTGVTGLGTGVAGALGTNVGSAGAPVVNGGVLGTPSSGTGTNIANLNASNLASGTVGSARGGAGTISGALKGNGSGVVSQAACSDLSNGATGCSTATGTSGATIPLNNAANTFSALETFSAGTASTVSAATAPTIDASGQPNITVANGSDAVIAFDNMGMVVVTDTTTGHTALYLLLSGNTVLIGMDSAWTTGTTPGAGFSSLAWSSPNFHIYNNTGSSHTYKLVNFRTH